VTVKSNLNARAYNSMRACTWRPIARPPRVSRKISAPATTKNEGLADVAAANPFRFPHFTREVEGAGRSLFALANPEIERRTDAVLGDCPVVSLE